jgi:hypothetical protein
MKAKVWILISSAMLIAGCVEPGNVKVAGCDSSPHAACTGNPDHPMVTIKIVQGTISADPPNVCAKPGVDLQVNLVPVPAAGGGTTQPKNPLDTWLVGRNDSNPAKIPIHIPSSVAGGKDYAYTAVNGGHCLDPMVHVN